MLVVDDDPHIRRVYRRVLSAAGHLVVEACDGQEAAEALDAAGFDAILSDVSMPGVGGLELLRIVRVHDPDVPVILVTGQASVESAVAAVEHGVLRYLLKPVETSRLRTEVERAVELGRAARRRREEERVSDAGASGRAERLTTDRALTRAIGGLWMAWQPILSATSREVVAYEALVRTTEPALPEPGALFGAAEGLGRLHDLGRSIRAAVARCAADAPSGADLFVNLHATDLTDGDLFAALAPLSAHAPRVVLEITERAALHDPAAIPDRIRQLRDLGYRIAIDDLGAGYATLSWFAVLAPDVAKLDLSLVRGVDQHPVKRKLVQAMVGLCRDLGVRVVAEGVELAAERDVVVELGCDLVQGYLFAHPGRGFPTASW